MDVVGGDGRDPGLGGSGVADEQVLAERRVAVHEHRTRLERLVRHLDQLLAGHPDDAGSREGRGVVAAEGEGGHVDETHGNSGGSARDMRVEENPRTFCYLSISGKCEDVLLSSHPPPLT